MFTLIQYLDGLNLVPGMLADCIFFSSLYWGLSRIKKEKENNE